MKKAGILTLSILVCLSLVFAGCGQSSNKDAAMAQKKQDYDGSYEKEVMLAEDAAEVSVAGVEAVPAAAPVARKSEAGRELSGNMVVNPEPPTDGFTADKSKLQQRKLVYTTNLTLETTEFETTNQSVQDLAAKYHGFIENSYVQGSPIVEQYMSRSASYTIRIPVGSNQEFLDKMNSDFHVLDVQQSVQDITKSYYDTDTWLKTLEERYKKLEELEKNAEDLQTMLDIEREMANVRYEINITYNNLQGMNAQVEYATVHITIQEVLQHTPIATDTSFFARIKNALAYSWVGFVSFIEDFVIGVIELLPFIIILAGIVIAILLRIKRKKRAKKVANEATATPEQIDKMIDNVVQQPAENADETSKK